jgi:hypothetical protein
MQSAGFQYIYNEQKRWKSGMPINGGDFFDTTRSQWNPETLDEEPSDGAIIRGIFERKNERLHLNKAI